MHERQLTSLVLAGLCTSMLLAVVGAGSTHVGSTPVALGSVSEGVRGVLPSVVVFGCMQGTPRSLQSISSRNPSNVN